MDHQTEPNQTLDRMTRSAARRMFQCDYPWRAPRHRSAFRSLTMKASICFITLLLAATFSTGCRASAFKIVALPRPNSGTFSFQQAEARKSEILSNAPTAKLENWENPDFGFCIHIGKDDSLTVYNHCMKRAPEYTKPRTGQSAADIERLLDELGTEGGPAVVLITSDVPLKDSKAIYEVLKVLFVPSVQLFYAQNSEPL
jgi:hypothetical protein